jgi:hypothetical protein
MDENDAMEVPFFFDEHMYSLMSDQNKMDLLLVISDLVNEKMKELVLDSPNKS